MAGQAIAGIAQVGLGIGISALQRELAGTTVQEGPRVDDIKSSRSDVGLPVPFIYGTVRVGGKLIWVGNVNEVRTQRTQSAKGLGPPPVRTITYTYFGQFAFLIGEGEIGSLKRIWADKKLIYDATGSTGGFTKYPTASFRLYDGALDQDVDPTIQASMGDFTPAHRGKAYVVFDDFPLADFGNRIPALEFEVVSNFAVGDAISNSDWSTNSGSWAATADHNARSPWGVIPHLRKIHGVQNNSNGLVSYDMDTGELVNDLGTTSPLIIGSEDEKFDNASFQCQSVTTTPDGRVFAVITAGDKHFTELNPVTLELLDRGRVFANDANAIITGGGGSTLVEGTQINTFAGPATGVFMQERGISGESDQMEARFYWVNKEQALGFFRQESQRLVSSGEQAAATTPDWQSSSGWITDNEGYLWTLVGDKTRISQGSNSLYVAGIVQVRADITAPAVPIFGPKIDVEIDYFDLTQHDIHLESFQDQGPGSFMGNNAAISIDRTTGYFVIVGSVFGAEEFYKVIVWDPSTRTVIRERFFDAGFKMMWHNGTCNTNDITNGKMHLWRQTGTPMGGNFLFQMDFDTLEVNEIPNTDFDSDLVDAANDQESIIFSKEENVIYMFPNSNVSEGLRFELDRVTSPPIDLVDIIEGIHTAVGLDVATQLDVDTALGLQDVHGYAFPGDFNGKQAIEQLAFAYSFDVAESDNKIAYTPKGEASAVTLALNDVGFGRGRTSEYIDEAVVPPEEIAKRFELTYPDPERDLLDGAQFATRSTSPVDATPSRDEIAIKSRVAMEANKAAKLAEIQLFSSWANRTELNTATRPGFLRFLPGDVITLTREDGTTIPARILQQKLGNGFTSIIECIEDDPETYLSTSSGLLSGVPSETLSLKGPTVPLIMDIPLLRDSDNSQNTAVVLYSAIGSFTATWCGGSIEAANDQITFEQFDQNSNDSTWGYLQTSLRGAPMKPNPVTGGWEPDSIFTTLDPTSTIDVYVYNNAELLSTATDAELARGANVAVIGSEVIQYQTVTDNGDGTVTLEDIRRGLRGSDELGMNGHKRGTEVIFVDLDTTGRNTRPIALIGSSVTYLGVTTNPTEGEPAFPPVVKEIVGNSEKPYTVADVAVDAAPGDRAGDVVVTWEPRLRIGGEDFWSGGGDPSSISESVEEYEVILFTQGGVWAGDVDGTTVEVVDALGGGEADNIQYDLGGGGELWSTTYGFPAFGTDVQIQVSIESFQANNGGFLAEVQASARYLSVRNEDAAVDGKTADRMIEDDNDGALLTGLIYEVTDPASTETVTSPTITFTAAERTSAGYGAQDRILVQISQKSGNVNVGNGFPWVGYI